MSAHLRLAGPSDAAAITALVNLRLGYSQCGAQAFPVPAKLKMPAHRILFSKPLAAALVATALKEATV